MSLFRSLAFPTTSHIANGLIHGIAADIMIMTLMWLGNWVEGIAQIHYEIMPLATGISILSVVCMFLAGFIPHRRYSTAMLSADPNLFQRDDSATLMDYRYVPALLGAQYTGWVIACTYARSIAEGNIPIWHVCIASLMFMVGPIFGVIISMVLGDPNKRS